MPHQISVSYLGGPNGNVLFFATAGAGGGAGAGALGGLG